mmetsp:Transcript_137132/g.238354  ORF Transcript_137132/g.238354 Transcript_137132/m.238354 type:complete len:138 (+) Transcript_137132:194-607(+)
MDSSSSRTAASIEASSPSPPAPVRGPLGFSCPFGVLPDAANALASQCLVAVALSAAFVMLLSCLGVLVAQSGQRCVDAGEGYTWCSIWQDCRALLSFLTGAALCRIFFQDSDADAAPEDRNANEEGTQKVQLCTYML